MKRRAIQLANNTLVVSLPAEWVKKKRVSKGDDLDVDEFQGKLMISAAKAATIGRMEVDISGLDPMIKRILGALYKSGYDEVKVKFSSIGELKVVQEVVREEFLGFEIIDQKKDWLVYKKVSSIEPREFDVMLRRMFLIILTMADDSLEALKKDDKEWLEVIALHDKDVNKIADFCRRVLNTTGAEGYKQIPPLYFIVEQLEKIADIYRDICRHNLKSNSKLSKETQAIYADTNKLLRYFYELFFDFSLEEMRDFAVTRQKLQSGFDGLFDHKSQKDVRMVSQLHNIAGNTFDMNGSLLAIRL